LTPGDGLHKIPGFVVSTWQTWQDLVARALDVAFGGYAVKHQNRYSLGESLKGTKGSTVGTTPDSVLCNVSPALVIDAKYKGRNDAAFEGVNEADFYETLAFIRAVGTSRAILIYPAISSQPYSTGTTHISEEIQLSNGDTIWAVAIEVNGISKTGGFLAFVEGLKQQVSNIVELTNKNTAFQ
jgi:5-methylcytosine-specific restriction endonuclease McrBC regulatory subunit McrC